MKGIPALQVDSVTWHEHHTPECNHGDTLHPASLRTLVLVGIDVRPQSFWPLGKNHRAMVRLEEVNTGDGIDKCSAHDDVFADGTLAVQKITQEPINPDEAVAFGAAVQAATSEKSSCQTPSKETVCTSYVDFALRSSRTAESQAQGSEHGLLPQLWV